MESHIRLIRMILWIADRGRALALRALWAVQVRVTFETKHVIDLRRHDPVSIRRTRTHLGIESDASARFEKGFLLLFSRTCTGSSLFGNCDTYCGRWKLSGIMDKRGAYIAPKSIVFSLPAICVAPQYGCFGEKVKTILSFEDRGISWGKDFSVVPPPYRIDVESVADIARKRLGRAFGYDRIESVEPSFFTHVSFQ